MSNTIISIIIPTKNRAHLIENCIHSLCKQNFDINKFEIILVDNNSTDNTRKIVEELQNNNNCKIKYLFEEKSGSHFARNNAAKIAKGEFLYFTDDDLIADPNMLSEILKTFDFHPDLASVTGRILPNWETQPPKWIYKYCNNYLLSLNDRHEEIIIDSKDVGIFSCHQMIKKDIFIKAGGFNPDIVNGEWIGDNETGLHKKIKKLGYKFGYNRNSTTYHQIPTSRITQSYLNNRFANQGNCDSYSDYREFNYEKEKLIAINREFKIKIIKGVLRYLIHRLTLSDKWHIRRAQINYFINRIKYNKKLINDKTFRKMVLINNWIDGS